MNLLKILDTTPEPPIIELDLSEANYSGDYHLGTPMYEYQKELTDQIISLHYSDILKYCETNDQRDLIIKSIETCIENCMLVDTHPYLLISHYMPKNPAVKDMPSKIAETSGKFKVLRDLLNTIIASQSQTVKSIGLVSSNNVKLFDLLESLLMLCEGNKSVKRYVGNNIQRESKKAGKNSNGNASTPNSSKSKSALGNKIVTNIHLIPADGEIQRDADILESTKFDLLIVVDGHVDTKSTFYENLKLQNHDENDKPTVTIRLIPLKTVEHITLRFENEKHKPNYLYKIISSVVCLRDHIGNIPPDVFPIYNQKLKYLAPNFFNILFNSYDFPAWPLPPLPTIQNYTPIDVERSLLTEAHFHYTPYGMNFSKEEQQQQPIPTYYELKRLQSDYIANPLKNGYSELIGISGHTDDDDDDKNNNNKNYLNISSSSGNGVLTHKVVLQLNRAYLNLYRVRKELDSFEKFNSPEVQSKVGRREKEMRKTVSTLFDDIDHAQQRIDSGKKLISKKLKRIESLKEEVKQKEHQLKTFEQTVEGEDRKLFVRNQLEIWDLQTQIKSLIAKTQTKDDEKNYTLREYQNSLRSIEESRKEQNEVETEIGNLQLKQDEIENDQREKSQVFQRRKRELMDSIKDIQVSNTAMERKLHHAFKFLKDTSHLKKRKIRTVTPNK
ncbi:uncharacterized protein LODBEIA_P19550 [Lodderomyces beijingensis]|uniref:HDA1 complex subunit 3 n=1 Tax=Lodderomyces beijingensis TaxID=1775926 RepID=A0ABP0ZKT2_9ASCO